MEFFLVTAAVIGAGVVYRAWKKDKEVNPLNKSLSDFTLLTGLVNLDLLKDLSSPTHAFERRKKQGWIKDTVELWLIYAVGEVYSAVEEARITGKISQKEAVEVHLALLEHCRKSFYLNIEELPDFIANATSFYHYIKQNQKKGKDPAKFFKDLSSHEDAHLYCSFILEDFHKRRKDLKLPPWANHEQVSEQVLEFISYLKSSAQRVNVSKILSRKT